MVEPTQGSSRSYEFGQLARIAIGRRHATLGIWRLTQPVSTVPLSRSIISRPANNLFPPLKRDRSRQTPKHEFFVLAVCMPVQT
jgi:hypothetical protein